MAQGRKEKVMTGQRDKMTKQYRYNGIKVKIQRHNQTNEEKNKGKKETKNKKEYKETKRQRIHINKG